jgi:hypothetical protein
MNTAVKTEDKVQITITWTEYNRLMHTLQEQLYEMEFDQRYVLLLELYRKMYMTRKVSEGKWENC